MVDDLLSEANVRRRGWFDANAVAAIIAQNRSGREDNALHVFFLLTLELWAREFLDQQV
jgi:asparagine synthase (glutamine-hydrolysing)